MGIVINDIEEIKKYLTIDKSGRRIYIVAEDITFNCAVPGNWHFDYTFSEGTSTDYNVEILAKKITFNYFADTNYIMADEIVCKELSCNELHVDKSICGELIRAYILNANKVKADSLSVVHMECAELDVEDCNINYTRYYKLKATNIRTIEEEDDD